MTEPPTSAAPNSVPAARLTNRAGLSWAWLVTLAAAVAAVWLALANWRERGQPIEIRFAEGHGIAAGDTVRSRGIEVGLVQSVELDPSGRGVIVHAALGSAAARLAGEATRFWIVRPRLDLGGVAGLDTIVGPRYVEMRPEGERPNRVFTGLDEAPAVESIEPGDLRLRLAAARRASLARGAGVYYRQVRVGTVLSVGLAADANAVEAEILVEARFAPLVRARTRFFPVGAVEFGLSLEGFKSRIDSLETLFLGGVAFATPPNGGRGAVEGSLFALEEKADEDWLEWEPSIRLDDQQASPND